MQGLISLPYEVLSNIVSNIDFDDVVNLGRTCKEFQFLHTEESICKAVVQTKIRYSCEAAAAMTAGGGHAAALRRTAKRREALATASPFTVATVGFGDAYLYSKGVLCYTLDDKVRVLDLHNSGQEETVISIPTLLTRALSDIGDNNRGVFHILYYSDNILSCLYKSSGPDSAAWLIAFNIKTRRILVADDLDSTDKIFVRHNKRFLYYGTHSEIGTDGYRKWVIRGFDFKTRKWFSQKVHLPDMVGSEIGSTICFEFYRDHFYALSNQTSFEVEEIDWTSFYHCVRFPLESPCNELLEKTENKSMWRRQHQEGPIDDRWTSLRLEQDECTGDLRIVESRKEWYLGSSRSQITYYRTDIIFPDLSKDEDEDEDEDDDFIYSQDGSIWPEVSTMPSLAPTSTLSTSISSLSSSSSSSSSASTASTTSSSLPTGATTGHKHDLTALPDDPILRLLRPDDNPHHMRPPPRLPQNTHPGNDGSVEPTFTLSKSRIRHYYTSASTYLDLVDDPLPTDWQGTQRLRLRAGSRKLGPLLVHKTGDRCGLLRDHSPILKTALEELYREQPILYWPPEQRLDGTDDHWDEVYKLLNPPSHLGEVHGTADERSIVYVTGGGDKPQAIVFVCFDPAIRLAGVKSWGGLCKKGKGVGEGPHIDGRATGTAHRNEDWKGKGKEMSFENVVEADRTITMDRKGKGKEPTCATAVQVQVQVECGKEVVDLTGEDVVDLTGEGERPAVWIQQQHRSWAWTEHAMYRDIGLGFYFGLPRGTP